MGRIADMLPDWHEVWLCSDECIGLWNEFKNRGIDEMEREILLTERLRRAGWRLTTEHPSSSYGIPVLVDPDGEAVGDEDLVSLNKRGYPIDDGEEWIPGRVIRLLLQDLGNVDTTDSIYDEIERTN